jgi:hypothetical protein
MPCAISPLADNSSRIKVNAMWLMREILHSFVDLKESPIRCKIALIKLFLFIINMFFCCPQPAAKGGWLA